MMAMAAGVAGITFSSLHLSPVSTSHLTRNTLFQAQLGFQKIRYQIKRKPSVQVVARLFGPAIFEASKLKVLFLGTHEENHPAQLPRTYTLTHSDITAKITLAISQSINKAQLQGWYNRLQRDEVLAQWKMSQGKMSLHVHCHISGGHWLLNAIAKLRFYIFRKELPVVLEAFRHGDRALFEKHPELEDALVWVYFHSNVKQFKRLECWGSLAQASKEHLVLRKHQKRRIRIQIQIQRSGRCRDIVHIHVNVASLHSASNFGHRIQNNLLRITDFIM